MLHLLKFITNVFSWKPRDMLEIDHEIIMHRLNVESKDKLVKQKKQKYPTEKGCHQSTNSYT